MKMHAEIDVVMSQYCTEKRDWIQYVHVRRTEDIGWFVLRPSGFGSGSGSLLEHE
jgi:hypothetical protein